MSVLGDMSLHTFGLPGSTFIRSSLAFMCRFILLNAAFHLLCTLTDFIYLFIFVLFLYLACLIWNYIIDTWMIRLFSVLGFSCF